MASEIQLLAHDFELYEHLAPWETRLLTIHPGSSQDAITTTLEKAAITYEKRGLGLYSADRNIEYEALSYTWAGVPSPSFVISCNGRRRQVTENLWLALYHLRNLNTARYLWVDFLCINQEDHEEKARQIRNMLMIYHRAKGVIVWLGLPGAHTKELFEVINGNSTSTDDMFPSSKSRDRTLSNAALTMILGNEHLLDALYDLVQRPWFRRTWVVQEVYAAESIDIHCGSLNMSWKTYMTISKRIPTIVEEADRASNTFLLQAAKQAAQNRMIIQQSFRLLDDITCGESNNVGLKPVTFEAFEGSSKFPPEVVLDRLLKSSWHLLASDPRDKVFALVGLTGVPISYGPATDIDFNGIEIDYSKSVAEVYARITKYLSRQRKFLGSHERALSLRQLYVRNSEGRSPAQDIPSWAIDWRSLEWNSPHSRPRLGNFGTHEPSLGFEIKEDWSGDDPWIAFSPQAEEDCMHWATSPEQTFLKLTGWCLGKITRRAFSHRLQGNTQSSHLVCKVMLASFLADFKVYCEQLATDVFRIHGDEPTDTQLHEGSMKPEDRLIVLTKRLLQNLSTYKDGMRWLVTGNFDVNDIVVAVQGGQLPLVLRRSNSGFRLVGYASPMHDYHENDKICDGKCSTILPSLGLSCILEGLNYHHAGSGIFGLMSLINHIYEKDPLSSGLLGNEKHFRIV